MASSCPRREDLVKIRQAVRRYEENHANFGTVAKTIQGYFDSAPELRALVHSTKARSKDVEHLEDKLRRKAISARQENLSFDITAENLFERLGDLAGVRLLHLRPRQIEDILPAVLLVLDRWSCEVVEAPFAYTWDEETKQRFVEMGVKTEHNPELYTSVHLVAEMNKTHHWRCEIQIRTLMEEVWGEVSHAINYPHETKSIACKEQLRVLARVASGGTRLVDSIFASLDEHQLRDAAAEGAAARTGKKRPKKK